MIRTYKCRTKVSKAGHSRLAKVLRLSAAGGKLDLKSRMAGRMKEKQDIGPARPRTVYEVVNFAI